MPPFLGFSLLTHDQPQQTAYLCHKLSALFDNPPITIHHDYSKCHLDLATLPNQVKIVKNWVRTGWGVAAVIDGYLSALRLLHAHDAPEWTVSLSSTDYPIRSAEQIFKDLRHTSADGFIDFRQITKGASQPPDARSYASAFQRPEYMDLAFKRYMSRSVNPRVILRRLRLRALFAPRDSEHAGEGIFAELKSPFKDNLRCFAGDWWHTINRRAATVLLEMSSQSRRLRHFYTHRPSPEESYFQTLLLNSPDLHIVNDNKRYSVWRDDNAHPKLLNYEDIPAMVTSSAHFARKFAFDPALFSAIDSATKDSSCN